MPAPCCCLRWAGTLPRPPECCCSPPSEGWCPLDRRSLGVLLKCLTCVFVILLTVPLVFGDECALRKRVPLDGASRALLAPQVVEAVVEKVTMGSPVYEVVFRVTRVYKKYRGHGRIKKRRTVSLPFRRPSETATADDCFAVADLAVRRKYFLFLSGAENRREPLQNIFPPIPSTKRAKRRIKNIVCSGCAKSPSVSRLRDDSVVRGQSANLTCTFDGSPAPSVTWMKDGKAIHPRRNRNIQIQTRRVRIRPRTRRPRRRRRRRDNRNGKSSNEEAKIQGRRKSRRKKMSKGRARPVRIISTMSLQRSIDSDAGIYSCVGKSVMGEASAKADLSVVPPLDPGIVYPCPYDSYCLNGGTCMFFKHFGEFVCQCAEGYKGQRCQEKEVFPTFRDHNCRGSLPFISPSRGLRCPRNQPVFLWEILQQSLAARKQKVSPWTKAHHLTWSPARTLTGLSWPPYLRSPNTPLTHLKPPHNPLNYSSLDFFIPRNEYRRKGQFTQHPASLGLIFALPPGLNTSEHDNTSQESQTTNILRSFIHPSFLHYDDPLYNNSQNNVNFSLNVSNSTSPLPTNVPKNYSGHHRNHGSVSILPESQRLLKSEVLSILPSSENPLRHHHNENRPRRKNQLNKQTEKWPLRPPPLHSNVVPRQSYVYPTSLTSTTDGSIRNPS